MRNPPFRIAAVVIATAGMLVAMLAGPATPAAADHPSRVSPFSADHQFSCIYMYTEGTMVFDATHVGEVPRVDVAGALAARLSRDCELELADVYAEFSAHIGQQVVDEHVVHLNDSDSGSELLVREYEFSMYNLTGAANVPIDHVEVTVCRGFGPMLPAFSCGDTVTVRPAD